MSTKLRYTFEEYINNPSGKGSAVTGGINRNMVSQSYASQLMSLESRFGKIKYECTKSNDDSNYYFHFYFPSESSEGLFYDIVIKLSGNKSQIASHKLKNYHVKFFSNSPSFIYTYAYAYKSHGLLINELENKLPNVAITTKAKTRNPDNTVGYEKDFYLAYLIMERDGLFNSEVINRIVKIGANDNLIRSIPNYSKKEAERRKLDLNKNKKSSTPSHSKMIKSKRRMEDSSSSIKPKMTKTTKNANTISYTGSRRVSYVKRTKKS